VLSDGSIAAWEVGSKSWVAAVIPKGVAYVATNEV